MPRFYCDAPLVMGQPMPLPAGAARHVQVLRLQPGDLITLFDGSGGEWEAVIEHMGRSEVRVRPLRHDAVEREANLEVHLAVGMPANDRMDWLVEKASELGVASVQPLLTERTVLRLTGERAERRRAHWQGIAVAASEQSGRNLVARIHPVAELGQWLQQAVPAAGTRRLLLSLGEPAQPLHAIGVKERAVLALAGPEGGLTPQEEEAARAAGFAAVTLGSRVLRAETAPLALLAALTLLGS